MSKKSILIKEYHHKELVKIAKTFGANYSNIIESMILYFKKTGINPTEAINENPAAMIKVLDKRIVSFLKVQERDILKPLRNEVHQYHESLGNQNNKLGSYILKLEKNGDENLKWMKELIVKMDDIDKNRTIRIKKELENMKNAFVKQQKATIILAELMDVKNKSGIQNKIKNLFNNAN